MLVAGGLAELVDTDPPSIANFGEFYNPTQETWYQTGPLVRLRESPTATLLTNGIVLVTGGFEYGPYEPLAAAEEFNANACIANPAACTGGLKVNLSPVSAVNAGAKWQVDGYALQNSGSVVSNLAAGLHILTFATVTAWTAPSAEMVTVPAGITNTATGTYTNTGGPVMSIRLTNGNQAVIAWPYPSTGASLQQNLTIGSTNWTAVTNSPVQAGSQWQVTLTPRLGTMFYRLH